MPSEKINARVLRINQLIPKLHIVLDAQDWPRATEYLPTADRLGSDRWEFYQNLGTIQSNLTHYQEAIQTFTKGIEVAEKALAHSVAPVKLKSDISDLLMGEGDAYNRLGNLDEAVALYTKASALSSQPAVALYHATMHAMLKVITAGQLWQLTLAARPLPLIPTSGSFYQLLAGRNILWGNRKMRCRRIKKALR